MRQWHDNTRDNDTTDNDNDDNDTAADLALMITSSETQNQVMSADKPSKQESHTIKMSRFTFYQFLIPFL